MLIIGVQWIKIKIDRRCLLSNKEKSDKLFLMKKRLKENYVIKNKNKLNEKFILYLKNLKEKIFANYLILLFKNYCLAKVESAKKMLRGMPHTIRR